MELNHLGSEIAIVYLQLVGNRDMLESYKKEEHQANYLAIQ